MSSFGEETIEAKPGDTMTMDEILGALDRRNCRYVMAIQTEAKNNPEDVFIRVEMTTGMQAFEAFGLAELINRHCARWIDKCTAVTHEAQEEAE